MSKSQSLAPTLQSTAIDRAELHARLLDRNLAIVNVMPADSFAAAHIPGSINLPVADIERRASQLVSDPEQEIAIYCAGPT